jgi:Ca-activated chloride channel family protein
MAVFLEAKNPAPGPRAAGNVIDIMRFSHPAALLLILVVPFVYLLAARRGRADEVARVWWSLVFKAATALFLALAVSGVQVPAAKRAAAIVFVVDRSESVAQTEKTAALEYLAGAVARLSRDDEAGIVVFAKDAVIEHPLTRGLSVGDVQSSPAATRSDVAKGLRLARSMLAGRPEADRRIVLMSDGNHNLGDALREAALAATEEIAVDVVPLRTSAEVSGRKVFLQDVSGPDAVRLGEPFDFRVTLRGLAKSEAVLRVLRDGTLRSTHKAVLASEGLEALRIPERISEPGFHQYRIVIQEPGGTDPASIDDAGIVVYAHGRATVLHVTESPPGLLDSILERQGFSVVVSPPGLAATAVSSLPRYDVIILDNVPARTLGEEWMRAMAAHVERDAVGLIMIGGAGSFGPGGFAGGPVERVLPVDMVRRDREKKPALALVLVLDKSGSMGMEQRKVSKIDMAKDAVLRLSELLTADDALGIIAFDRSPREVLPLRPGVSPASVEASIRGLTGGGGTAMLPAVELAYEWLAASVAEKKHILLLSDGQAEAAERDPLLKRVAGSSAVLSTVGIGGDVDRGFMEMLAGAAHGRTYFTESGADLSDILKREGVLISGQWLVERPFTPRQPSAHEILQNLGETGVPGMAGYVAATPKPLSEVVLTSDTGDPILACWRAGLGKTLAFTSDLSSSWTRQLVAWEHFGRMWAQMVRWTSRGLQSESLHAKVKWDGGAATLVVDSFDRTGRFGNLLSVRARMQTPDGRSVDIDLPQTAPGCYEGPFDYSGKGSYFFSVTARDPASGAESAVHFGSDLSKLPEDRSPAADGAFLAALASAGHGSVLDRRARQKFGATGPPAYSEAWQIAAVLAMLFFLLDVAVRRGWKLNLGLWST